MRPNYDQRRSFVIAALDPMNLTQSGAMLLAALVASSHAVIYKREPRSAALWSVIIWLVPAVGPVLYFLLGINRVQRRAAALRGDMVRYRTHPELLPGAPAIPPSEAEQLRPLARLVGHVVGRPVLPGNLIEPLVNGDQAYPAMLATIESAQESLGLASYIFDGEGIGHNFVAALDRANRRGVVVRVLVDDVSARFSR